MLTTLETSSQCILLHRSGVLLDGIKTRTWPGLHIKTDVVPSALAACIHISFATRVRAVASDLLRSDPDLNRTIARDTAVILDLVLEKDLN